MSNTLVSTQNGLRFAFNRKSEGMHGLLKTDNGGLVKVIKDGNRQTVVMPDSENAVEGHTELSIGAEKSVSTVSEQPEKNSDSDVWDAKNIVLVEDKVEQKARRGRKPKIVD